MDTSLCKKSKTPSKKIKYFTELPKKDLIMRIPSIKRPKSTVPKTKFSIRSRSSNKNLLIKFNRQNLNKLKRIWTVFA
jgi:hypothetical protein